MPWSILTTPWRVKSHYDSKMTRHAVATSKSQTLINQNVPQSSCVTIFYFVTVISDRQLTKRDVSKFFVELYDFGGFIITKNFLKVLPDFESSSLFLEYHVENRDRGVSCNHDRIIESVRNHLNKASTD